MSTYWQVLDQTSESIKQFNQARVIVSWERRLIKLLIIELRKEAITHEKEWSKPLKRSNVSYCDIHTVSLLHSVNMCDTK